MICSENRSTLLRMMLSRLQFAHGPPVTGAQKSRKPIGSGLIIVIDGEMWRISHQAVASERNLPDAIESSVIDGRIP